MSEHMDSVPQNLDEVKKRLIENPLTADKLRAIHEDWMKKESRARENFDSALTSIRRDYVKEVYRLWEDSQTQQTEGGAE